MRRYTAARPVIMAILRVYVYSSRNCVEFRFNV
jgi:hypothetical protein